ncbi:MAG: hypothetical protein UX44_C0024G0018 [candidate division WWE3 bacterium GW2011_GWA1_46_21]|uniref:HTH cro/C1-type domain-containing protein n=2 Tax=Katanobacteria TaxID=422282 RepID=A0A0G1RK62_UNCKA|nr:MAG: hypothetical protein UX44_C0024G0018 [candidate division WWE3 bacterium GW2011_GWA1_46_21]KKU49698.1 MAG: hypothetical protein UX73_C0029G0005 [candidate division WWE3 bacterium GW2011_GWC1_47_10]
MTSVGEILSGARENKRLTLDDIHKFTKIHPRYLKALEAGDYEIFSNRIHAKGFLKIYSEFLGLNVDQMLAFWRREYEKVFENREQALTKKVLPGLTNTRVFFTPAHLVGGVVFVLILGFFAYLFYQYKSYSGAPELQIYSPQNSVVVTNGLVDVTGKTDLDAILLINNQRVILNTDGSFATSIKLNEGLNTLNFKSVNKLGRETEVVRTIIYRATAVDEAKQASESTR